MECHTIVLTQGKTIKIEEIVEIIPENKLVPLFGNDTIVAINPVMQYCFWKIEYTSSTNPSAIDILKSRKSFQMEIADMKYKLILCKTKLHEVNSSEPGSPYFAGLAFDSLSMANRYRNLID